MCHLNLANKLGLTELAHKQQAMKLVKEIMEKRWLNFDDLDLTL